ncbi:aminoglycoside 3'-phosphotransferase [Pseudomonas sp. BCA14]|uniref:APH(3')-II family aminoglycoside O-phosphotransferase n=1 Tax=unclassified Pseudomonas TaxID=196821 RepID=UPI00106EBC93|nr:MULTISPECIES: APH(3') family aminoglycoside O-phosphotransferase [unclassified Pseudomonas]TFF05894.1 aminoglycoside 3'-phosphotransferase [Pseudomonas sp. JMN1]TFF08147.1 aminoglycoside 3'-phosphotransferase [Pseudomonas sp. BCA17]TFF23938.1 aminoglycoside 3'-phosphotransferase [Pseudomonas sp. BCA14]TFF28189.1 aminoglycoside 3'-phosphotransferase [Pseudomonas sp. BCA13]
MNIPNKWRGQYPHALVEQQAIGESRADVFRLRQDDGTDLFLKSEPLEEHGELADEIKRLRWLRQVDLPAPVVLDEVQDDHRHWLLMTTVPGQDLASASELSAAQVINLLATALRTLHQVPIARCPFDHSLEQRIARAQAHVSAGRVDESDFDDERLGQSAEDVFAELLSTQPEPHDRVVTHGDACLPNFMAAEGHFSGFIDCGRLGISDRYQDLALAARSIQRNLGQAWVKPFFEVYGVEPDEQRIKFYCLLDEFF